MCSIYACEVSDYIWLHMQLLPFSVYMYFLSTMPPFSKPPPPIPFKVTCLFLFLCPVYYVTALILDGEYCGEIFSITLYLLFHHFQSGWSPLMRASRNGHEGVLRMLLSQGATVDVFNKVVNTSPLYPA